MDSSSTFTVREVTYHCGTTMMRSWFCAPLTDSTLPGILLIHDAFGVTDAMRDDARSFAALGYAVLAADVWGEGLTPRDEAEFGPLIAHMAEDREAWTTRVEAAHRTLLAQPETTPAAVAMVGYCFGGSSALEYLRCGAGGGSVAGVVGIHAGLDLLGEEWSDPSTDARVLLCTGAEDPMATAAQRADLQQSLTAEGIEWEVGLYGETKHAFTSPASGASSSDAVAYNPYAARRARQATEGFLDELFAR